MWTAIRRAIGRSPAPSGDLGVLHSFLELARPLDSVERTRELGENAVSGRLDHPAAISLGARADYIAKQRHPPPVSARLIFGHQDRIADDIHESDCCQPSRTAIIGG